MANSFPGSGQVQVDCLIFTAGGPMGFCSSGIACDGFPYARFGESWGIRFASPDTRWILSTAGTFVAGYSPSGTDWGAGNMIACGCIGIGTTGVKMPLTFKDALGGKILLNDNQNNYSIGLASGIVSGDASMKFTSGCMTAGDTTFYRGSTLSMIITCAGNIGVNTSAPSYMLQVNGTFYAAGSSKEYKTSICEYNTDSCMFMKLKPVTYDYKEEWKHLGKQLKSGTQIGLIAEDTAEVFPELAVLKEEENEQVVRNVDYEKLSVILLTEVQKLRREVDDLKHK